MRSTTPFVLALVALGATTVLPLAAQQGPRSLPAPDKEFEEPFSSVASLRELRDGRVIVADPRDKVLSLVDFSTGSATTIGREGSGPQEYGMPMRLYSAAGDSTYLFDPMNMRYLIIGADGKPVNTFRTEVARQPSRPAGEPTGAARLGARPGAGNAVVTNMATMTPLIGRAADARGRLYAEGSAMTFTEAGPVSADSVPILRFDRSTNRIDTLAYIRLPASNVQMSEAGNGVRVISGAANPLLPRDEWAVFPDGRVAIVRANTYHVDFIMPDGNKRSGARIAYTPVRMTAAEIRHEEALRAAARAGAMSISYNVGGGNASGSSQGPSINTQAPEPLKDWPDVKPPFRPGMASVLARPNGELWVRRTESLTARGTLWEVITPQGAVAYQVRIQEGWLLAGFGANSIYTTRRDEDDLVYLQRHQVGPQAVRGNN